MTTAPRDLAFTDPCLGIEADLSPAGDPGEVDRDTLAGTLVPIGKRSCFRSLAQGLERLRLRQVRGGRKDFGKYFLRNWIIDGRLVGLHYPGTDGAWCPVENHEPLSSAHEGRKRGHKRDCVSGPFWVASQAKQSLAAL